MHRCVITPTFSGHFSYIKDYLRSFERYLTDRDFPIVFIIDKAEADELRTITNEYMSSLNISIICFEDVLESFGISEKPESMLNNLGRISFQTIKKYYSALYTGCDQFLILDSESIMIRKTNLSQLFDGYFASPSFFTSQISDRPLQFSSGFTYGFMESASQITKYPKEFWTLESYNWFIDSSILRNMIDYYGGNLYRSISTVRNPGVFHDEGVEGELLYYPYIIYTNEKYGYQIYDVADELEKSLGKKKKDEFLEYFYCSFRAHAGYLEGLACFVTESNLEGMIDFMKSHYLPIFRVSRKISKELSCLDEKAQLKFIRESGVHIIASSYTDLYLKEFVYY